IGDALADPMNPLAVEAMAEVSADLGFFCCGDGIAVDPIRKRIRRAAPVPLLLDLSSKNLCLPWAHPSTIIHRSRDEVTDDVGINYCTRSRTTCSRPSTTRAQRSKSTLSGVSPSR